MLTFTNKDAQGIVEKNLGPEARAELGDLDFLPFPEYVPRFSLRSPLRLSGASLTEGSKLPCRTILRTSKAASSCLPR